MYNIIPLAAILIASTVIIALVVRKLGHLSSVDTGTIAEAKAEQTKTKIIDERLKRKFKAFGGFFKPMVSGAKQSVSGGLERVREKLETAKEQLENERLSMKAGTPEEKVLKQEMIEEKLEEAQEMAEDDNFETAEKKFIDVISHDPKNIEAYSGLANLYSENKKYTEAAETYNYLHKLEPAEVTHLSDAAQMYMLAGQNEKAAKAARHAVHQQPRNPKLLDMMVDISILLKNKEEASIFLEQLREVNPENQKLDELKETIEQL